MLGLGFKSSFSGGLDAGEEYSNELIRLIKDIVEKLRIVDKRHTFSQFQPAVRFAKFFEG